MSREFVLLWCGLVIASGTMAVGAAAMWIGAARAMVVGHD